MGWGSKFAKASAATFSAVTTTVAKIVITWTANEPTAATTQTIADGSVPTVAELGQYVANINAQQDNAVDDIEALKAAQDQIAADIVSIRNAINEGE